MVKIIEKIRDRRAKLRYRSNDSRQPSLHDCQLNFPGGNWYYSFEFFPPKTEAGLDNLLTRIDRMAQRLDPLFIDVTWGSDKTSARTMALASHAQKYLGVDVLLHLSCQGMTRDQLIRVLDQAKVLGIHNILALRGDPPKAKKHWQVGDVSGGECERAIDLVRLIRNTYGDYFGIAVAGHPEGHPSSTSPEDELDHLKEKMRAGADFIISQFVYDTERFLDFCYRCRDVGIQCPILPGIMPIQSYSSFTRMTQYCGVSVPDEIWKRLEPIKDDDEAVKEIGCSLAAEMCRQILADPIAKIDGVHFYTLNLERSATRILMQLGAVEVIVQQENIEEDHTLSQDGTVNSGLVDKIRTKSGRILPWRPSAMTGRSKMEQVRPINWANRPKSYVLRTEDWDEFPNGRWGDSTSPAFGELSNFSHYYSFSLGSEDDQRNMLGSNPTKSEDVYEVFALYIEGKIPHIPWCEATLQPESFLIQTKLAALNRAGFLTINSQPSVNAALSTHESFGWGGPGGYIYQKAYCECFCSPENMRCLINMVKQNQSMNVYAVNNAGNCIQEGTELGGVTALTWGVFPNREILQPTIFDPRIFLVWAEEAFSLWTSMWSNLYDYDSDSFDLIETIRDTYYLCAIIDNDYISESNRPSLWEGILNASQWQL